MPASRLHPHLLHFDQSILVVVDMQEPFLRTLHDRERVLKNVAHMMKGAAILRVPIVTTTQYAEKMGGLLPEIKSLQSPNDAPINKITFSCCGNVAFNSLIQRSGRKQIILCGVESHICVSQTAHELVGMGYQVHVATDAVSARTEENDRLGLDKMRQAGVLLASVESVLYELLGEADSPEFRQILSLIK